ncbi:MAG: cupin domain-containing protein [Burkholderiales bacterium]|jgi:gentisate 1,2-dioxygenase
MAIMEKEWADTQSEYEQRAHYICNENGFAFSFPPVPVRQFREEHARAVDPATPSSAIMLDASDALGSAWPATTPTLLCRYIRIRAGEQVSMRYRATGEICYVLAGRGQSGNAADTVIWKRGDVFCLPGGTETTYRAEVDAILFNVTDEPVLSYTGVRAPDENTATVETVVWRGEDIDRHLEAVFQRPMTTDTTGASVQFATRRTAPGIATIPFINTAINTLEAGRDQRAHRHNGVAVTLALQGDGIHSLIDGERVDWITGVAQITPATRLHSHHNRGDRRMRSFVIQDEGLHVYTRTPGFSFD